jgi:hypothetical protein
MDETIRKRVASYSSSIRNGSSGLVHLVRETNRDVTRMETTEILKEFFNKTFIRHLILGTCEMSRRNERVQDLHENYNKFRSNGTRYRGDDDMYEYGSKKCLTNLKNHLNMNLERFMIRSMFGLYPRLSRKRIRTIINGISDDRQHEQKIEFVDRKTSRRRRNEASLLHVAIQERRTVLGFVN